MLGSFAGFSYTGLEKDAIKAQIKDLTFSGYMDVILLAFEKRSNLSQPEKNNGVCE
jgi:hypothetical protein